ncbi:winged helix-turn-helix domain-containing protein [Pseudomonas viridiflava]|uniref:winged helix-turn-helix domain-containing protein n=2 Tax=Pseudomonas viridiflava TaxID=33069 RepID=UPI000F021C7A|nr:winged helix-turn-helix domain-containing protein [Pseudomonas viridiflava]
MNEKIPTIDFSKCAGAKNPYGSASGKLAHAKLLAEIENLGKVNVIGVSFGGLDGADVSFLREALVYVIKRFKNEIAFYVTDLPDEDIVANLQAAAESGGQPVTYWSDDKCRFLGLEQSSSSRTLLDFIASEHSSTTSKVAEALAISVQNASTRLKRLYEEGYVMRIEETAETGGREYVYRVAGGSV